MMKKATYYKIIDNFFKLITYCASILVFVIVSAIFISLVIEAFPAIEKFGFIKFIASTDWDPVKEIFGAATTIYGTIMTTLLALIFAIPLSIGIAIFITEICPIRLKPFFSTTIELLAAIPSIIYGMWGLFTLAPIMGNYVEPFIQSIFSYIPLINKLFSGTTRGIDLFTSGLILSIMITPFITSIVRDTFELTPQPLKESAYGVGATKWEVIKDVMIPYCKMGIYGSVIIAMGRALGETMAVAFVLGNKHQISTSLFDASATITVTLANEFTEADSDIYLSSLFYLALILFTMSFILLALAKYFLTGRKLK
jgi:phosphate transport system permease protein